MGLASSHSGYSSVSRLPVCLMSVLRVPHHQGHWDEGSRQNTKVFLTAELISMLSNPLSWVLLCVSSRIFSHSSSQPCSWLYRLMTIGSGIWLFLLILRWWDLPLANRQQRHQPLCPPQPEAPATCLLPVLLFSTIAIKGLRQYRQVSSLVIPSCFKPPLIF